MNITDSGFQVGAPLALPEDEVHLWRVDLEAIRADESCWQQVLSSDELTRASRFHFPSDRQRFVASRALLRTILASYLATDPSGLSFSYSRVENPPRSCWSAHGFDAVAEFAEFPDHSMSTLSSRLCVHRGTSLFVTHTPGRMIQIRRQSRWAIAPMVCLCPRRDTIRR